MEVYIFIEILFLLFIINKRFYYNYENILFYISIFIIVFIFTFKGTKVGFDTADYVSFYENKHSGYGTIDHPTRMNFEPIFTYFSRLIKLFSSNYTFYFFCYSLFVLFPFFYLIKKKSNNYIITLILFLTYRSTLYFYMGAMRQTLAVAIILYAIIIYEQKSKYWMYISSFLIIIAMFTHTSMYLVVPILLLIFFIEIPKKASYVLLSVSLIIGVAFQKTLIDISNNIQLFLANTDLENMQANITDDLQTSNFIIIAPFTFVVGFTVYLSSKIEYNTIYMKSLVFTAILYNLLNSYSNGTRIALIFSVLGFISIAPLKIRKSKTLYYFYILISLYYIWRAISGYLKAASDNLFVNYNFIWS